MNITITYTDPVSQPLEAFMKDQPRVLDTTVLRTGNSFAKFVRTGYLSGQMLRMRTGKSSRGMKARKLRGQPHAYRVWTRVANLFERGGEIKPREHSALRFQTPEGTVVFTRRPVALSPRPFLSQAVSVFDFQSTFVKAAEEEIAKAAKKRGLK